MNPTAKAGGLSLGGSRRLDHRLHDKSPGPNYSGRYSIG